MPLAAAYFFAFVKPEGAASLEAVVANGELYLLATAMCAAGIGEVYDAGEKLKIPRIGVVGLSVLLFSLSSLMFGMTYVTQDTNTAETLKFSMIAFVSAFFLSTAAVALSEASK